MKTIKQDKADGEKHAKVVSLRWLFITLFFSIAVIALMLSRVSFAKDRAAMNYHVSSSFCAGDVALFVAMPLLNAAIK